MEISAQTDLMLNQRHATVMKPDDRFEVLQTSDGDAVFFSLGTDDVFYVTREVKQTSHGWVGPGDLSSVIGNNYGGAPVQAISFAVSQNTRDMSIDLALAVRIKSIDYLYVALGHANTPDAWEQPVQWKLMDYDADPARIKPPKPLRISKVFLSTTLLGGKTADRNCFVDIVRSGNSNDLLTRLYVDVSKTAPKPRWYLHDTGIDVSAGILNSSCPGHRKNDLSAGMYTFGFVGKGSAVAELAYSPQYDTKPGSAASVSTLWTPPGTASIAVAPDAKGYTNLFVAAKDGLWLYKPDNQMHDGKGPVQIVNDVVHLPSARELTALRDNNRIVIWGINSQNELFYISCPDGKEATKEAWSTPIILLAGVENFSLYMNKEIDSAHVVFAQLSGQELRQLTQDPTSGCWKTRNILLPGTAVNDMVEYSSFTSHIVVKDETGAPAQFGGVEIVSTQLVSLYVNNSYYVLVPDTPVTVRTTATGILTVVQEAPSLAHGVPFTIRAPAPIKPKDNSPPPPPPEQVTLLVDPLSKAMDRLARIQSGDDFSKVPVVDENGNESSLIPDDVSKDDAAASIKQLVDMHNEMPADGSVTSQGVNTMSVSAVGAKSASTTTRKSWSITVSPAGAKFQHGPSAVQSSKGGKDVKGASKAAVASSLVESDWGSLGKYLAEVWDGVVNADFSKIEDGLWQAVITIGEKAYKAYLDCKSKVMQAIDCLISWIKIAWDKLMAALDDLLQWPAIIRTHNVFKAFITSSVNEVVGKVDGMKTRIDNLLIEGEAKLAEWANLSVPEDVKPPSQTNKSRDKVDGEGSPKSNWLMHHLGGGAKSIESSDNTISGTIVNIADDVLQTLEKVVTAEGKTMLDLANKAMIEVIANIGSISVVELIKKVLVLIADLILGSAKNLIDAIFDIVEICLKGMLSLMNAKIDIPVISNLYSTFIGEDLTLMNLVCLLGAIPANLMFRAATGKQPFPSGSTTDEYIKCTSIAQFRNVVSTGSIDGTRSKLRSAGFTTMAEEPVETEKEKQEREGRFKYIMSTMNHLAGASGFALVIVNAILSLDSYLGDIGSLDGLTMPGGMSGMSVASAPAVGTGLAVRGASSMVSATGFLGNWEYVLGASKWVLYLGFLAPTFGAMAEEGIWDNPSGDVIFNWEITFLSILKSLVDSIPAGTAKREGWDDSAGPILECTVNFIWYVPLVWWWAKLSGKKKTTKMNVLQTARDFFFNASGMIAILTQEEFKKTQPEVYWAGVLGGLYYTSITSGLSFGVADQWSRNPQDYFEE